LGFSTLNRLPRAVLKEHARNLRRRRPPFSGKALNHSARVGSDPGRNAFARMI